MRTKKCTQCHKLLPIDRFHKSHLGPTGAQIYKPSCKQCLSEANQLKYRALTPQQRSEWYGRSNSNKRYHKNYRLVSKYGISLDQFTEMYSQQGGKCYICSTPTPNHRICVDHHHNTGTVRKLLCHNCNVILGHAKEDPAILMKCAEYLLDSFRNTAMEEPVINRESVD